MKLKLSFCISFIWLLQFSNAQTIIPLGGALSKVVNNQEDYISARFFSESDAIYHGYALDEKDFEISPLFEFWTNLAVRNFWRIGKDSVLIIDDRLTSIGRKNFLNYWPNNWFGPSSALKQDTVSAWVYHYLRLNDGIIGIDTGKRDLFFFDKKGVMQRQVEIKGNFSESARHWSVSGDSTLVLFDYLQESIFEFDTLGNVSNNYSLPSPSIGKVQVHNDNYYTFGTRDSIQYLFTYFDKKGNVEKRVNFENTCENCFFNDVIIDDDFLYFVGRVSSSRELYLNPIENDPLILKIDYGGNLISSKFYEDDVDVDNVENSYFLFGFASEDDELLICGNFDVEENNNWTQVSGGYIKTDKNLSDLMEFDYGKAKAVFSKVSPNPTSDKLNVQIYTVGAEFEFSLFSIEGTLKNKTTIIENGEIDTSQLENGVYIYQLINKETKQTNSGKIVVYH